MREMRGSLGAGGPRVASRKKVIFWPELNSRYTRRVHFIFELLVRPGSFQQAVAARLNPGRGGH